MCGPDEFSGDYKLKVLNGKNGYVKGETEMIFIRGGLGRWSFYYEDQIKNDWDNGPLALSTEVNICPINLKFYWKRNSEIMNSSYINVSGIVRLLFLTSDLTSLKLLVVSFSLSLDLITSVVIIHIKNLPQHTTSFIVMKRQMLGLGSITKSGRFYFLKDL